MKTFTAGRAQITAGFVFIDADPDTGAGPKPELMSLYLYYSLFTRRGPGLSFRGRLKIGGEEKGKRGSCQRNLPELGYSWSTSKFQLMWVFILAAWEMTGLTTSRFWEEQQPSPWPECCQRGRSPNRNWIITHSSPERRRKEGNPGKCSRGCMCVCFY